MSAYRLAAIDLDGTLLSSANELSPRTVEALVRARAAGIEPVIVTSRDIDEVLSVRGITDAFRTAICCGGSAVYDLADRTLLSANWLAAADVAEALHAVACAIPTAVFGFVSPVGVRHCPDFPSIPGLARAVVLPRESIIRPADNVFKAFVLDAAHEYEDGRFVTLVRDIIGNRAATGHYTRRFVELVPPQCGKMQTLRTYCMNRNITSDEVMAFGDSVGDLSMLRWAGRGVAVENADPLVLRAADETTESCDNDGVAKTLERYLH